MKKIAELEECAFLNVASAQVIDKYVGETGHKWWCFMLIYNFYLGGREGGCGAPRKKNSVSWGDFRVNSYILSNTIATKDDS